MPRPKKNPNAVTFDFALNPQKEIAKTTLSNYKNALNKLAQKAADAHALDSSKPLIKTKDDLLNNTAAVLDLLKDDARLTKSTAMASIFYIIGRQDEKHPYVQAFRQTYYTESYRKKLEAEGKLVPTVQEAGVENWIFETPILWV